MGSNFVEFDRPPRAAAPDMPEGTLALQEPPALREPVGGGLGSLLTYLPIAISSGATVLIFTRPGGAGNTGMFLAAGLMAVSTVGMFVGGMGRNAGQHRAKMRAERRDYLRFLTQTRRSVRRAVDEQRAANAHRHPQPSALWTAAVGSRLWERRGGHPDFAEVRMAAGSQRLGLRIASPQTKPVEDLEPLCARALRRFIRAYVSVPHQPIAVNLRSYSHLSLSGDAAAARDCVRAMLAELAVFHAPEDLRIVVCAGEAERADWEWVKWLPHAGGSAGSPLGAPAGAGAEAGPGADGGSGGAARPLWAAGLGDLHGLLGAGLSGRPGFEADASVLPGEPYTVVVLDGGATRGAARWTAPGYRNTVVLDVAGALSLDRVATALRLRVSRDLLESVDTEPGATERTVPLGRPDRLTGTRALVLARLLAPVRLTRGAERRRPLESDLELTALLGIKDFADFDPEKFWAAQDPAERLSAAIGVDEGGTPVRLDIKEPAFGGMGPHGMLVGATGSGKSELLRTLVLALALTHSPETLNFVLVDFKGGATFLGLDRLFHSSAVITNLADEVHLVARMQDTLHGELVRRQELLRAAGNYVNIHEYEKARAAGTPLDPLPTLFVVVDEFSELISAHREFLELFIVIGRVGRSLGVHLLLASQRLDQGRMSQLETHLSYRIGLRTFSAAESRAVIGVADAHHLPSAPGNGFLAHGTDPLLRFKAAYVSGQMKERAVAALGRGQSSGVLPFDVAAPERWAADAAGAADAPVELDGSGPDGPDTPQEATGDTGAGTAPESDETLMEMILDRLEGFGPPAHQVWLPPLSVPPTLDHLLPPLTVTADAGLRPSAPADGESLLVPLGIVDRPFLQRRDVLTAELTGSGGHVGIAGGPQSGKSTLVRTLICSLALTHTAEQVQFYALDFGGGTLSAVAGLPHVGGVAGRLDTERIGRTMAHVRQLLDDRERRFAELGVDSMAAYRKLRAQRTARTDGDHYGDVFLVIDGWSTLRQEFDDLVPVVRMLAGRGLNYGVHLVISTTRWTELPAAIRDLLGSRFELRLGDAVESVVDARTAQTVPRDHPGRGLTTDKQHFLAALPRVDGGRSARDLAEGTAALVEAVSGAWTGPAAPAVRTLPTVLRLAELPEAERAGRHADLRVPVGWDEQRLQPVWHDFAEHPHLAAVGDAESGRTNLLRLFARSVVARFDPDEAQLLLIDPRRRLGADVPEQYRLRYAVTEATAKQAVADVCGVLQRRVPGPDIAGDRLEHRDWWSGPRVFVLADDYDMVVNNMSGTFDPLLEMLAYGGDIGVHVVAARLSAGASRPDKLLKRLTDLNQPGLVFSSPPVEGPILGVKTRLMTPGRALLVSRRSAELVQTALVPEAGPAAPTAYL